MPSNLIKTTAIYHDILYLDVELYVVSVELVVVVVQEVVSLQAELTHYGVELINQTLHTFCVCEREEVRGVGVMREEGGKRETVTKTVRENK